MQRLLAAALCATVAAPLLSQQAVPADSARLTIVVYSSLAQSGAMRDDPKKQTPLRGATVALNDGRKLTSDDSGHVLAGVVPGGRTDFVVTAEGHRRYRCRAELKKGAENGVRVDLLSDRQAEAWGKYGCRRLY